MMDKFEPDFDNLFHKYHRELINLSYNIVRDKDAAKDVVQEVFIKLWRNKDSIEFGDQIKHYLFRATSHTSLNFLRSQKRKYKLEDYNELLSIIAPPGTESMNYLELELRVRQAIDRLPPRCKTIFLLSRHEGLKYHEIAETMALSVKTVENQMGIALEKLRADLKPFLTFEFFAILIAASILLTYLLC